MKTKLLSMLVLTSILFSMSPKDFFSSQMSFPRVKNAQKNKGAVVNNLLTSNGISTASYDLFIRAFKTEKTLEIWAKNKNESTYKLIKTYAHCASSGVLGPKRRSGDKQTPEGFYTVDLFNPTSNYYLSFRISYPNASDKIFADPINPGDNIFIHGNCVTIGCIPVGDDAIDEIYLLAAKAKVSGEIPVHIFPTKMTAENMAGLKSQNAANADFWDNIKPGYDAFENTKTLPKVSVDASGKYVF
jgi:murein L,D-transpeptidase YafK